MKPQDDKAFTAAEATIVQRSATGSVRSSSASSYPRKSIVTISAYNDDQGERKRITNSIAADQTGVPVQLHVNQSGQQRTSVVQIGCFSPNISSPKKLTLDQLKSFQGQQRPVDSPKNRSVTFINSSSVSPQPLQFPTPKMMTIMSSSSSAIPRDSSSISSSGSISSSPNGSSKAHAELDTFALDSGTCSDLEINSSSSSLNNSITPPPPPLPKKMNKTKEKLKSENEKFFHMKNYHRQQQHQQTTTATNNMQHQQPLHLNDQDDNMSVLSCGSNNSSSSSFSLISCDSLNATNRRLLLNNRSLLPHSPTTTTTSYSSSSDSPTPSSVGGDPPVIVSDPENRNAIVLSVKSAVSGDNNRFQRQNLLPTSLLADIRSSKRSSSSGNNGSSHSNSNKKNVNVISIRPSSSGGGDDANEGTTIEFHSITTNGVRGGSGVGVAGEPEKYLTKQFINFSINSMMDSNGGQGKDVDDEEEDEKLDRGYFEGQSERVKSAFASMDSRKSVQFENDSFYNFHINENNLSYLLNEKSDKSIYDTNEDSFAGYRDLATAYSPMSGSSTIRSNKGTIRGVKNRVRNGIATFLQMQHANIKNYKEKDAGKVVVYTTTMGIVRDTYAKCANVKQILRTLLVKFEERDVFMSTECQQEIKDRMQSEEIKVPQLFVDGQYIGDADGVERLNEAGELRKMLKVYQSLDASLTCRACGGYRLLPCSSCNGSKKSVHRNHFTAEFIALKCMNCDEVGLVRCDNC